MAKKMIRVSSAFYFDHTAHRELEAPPILRENRSHVWIDPMHGAAVELLNDANYYASGTGFDFADSRRIINGAKQTRRALLKAGTALYEHY